ncbi:S-adenosyl-L-methionine-dependent methyltransferase [Fomitopsis serialis]|uniref:S-adenosyl-L-methionine-dependent methyltransferase n=1 Tax=Fomitopsis serialis TaxID=139415 RepID=UPI002007A7F5|nr:S-adenosyl-L-methionine-dependent methyltransferase [Neoantrodia serialis]KAH9934260.1 S-adenosyl-L-methionine-dependent methyltransferase [Neoantrodia serialis]
MAHTASPVPTPSNPIEHQGRTYQSYPGSNYVLPSDAAERERYVPVISVADTTLMTWTRLSLQHRLLKSVYENRVILPPVNISSEDCVLDSGTGSGTWLLDAIESFPASTTVDAVDIESRLWPVDDPRIIERGNVNFHVGNVTSLPEDWTARFKLVHQRLLVAALRSPEWTKALEEISRVLQPDGWVQLGEVGPWKAGPTTARHLALFRALFRDKDLDLDCATHIPDVLREVGFTDVTVEERTMPIGSWAGQLGIDARDDLISVFRGVKTPILNAGGYGFVASETEFEKLLDEVEREIDETPGAEAKFYIIYARKPSVNVHA